MLKRAALIGVVAFVCPGLLHAEGVTIDHSAVGCIVAGQYPQMNACFSPVENVARARVYFRAAGGPYWYFVEMKPGTPKKPGVGAANVVPAAATAGPTGSCFQGVLPKPKKTILKMDYYVEVVDKGFAEARTTEYQPDVVDAAGKCKRDLPIAPFVSKASVAVGAAAGAPTVPIGFAAAGVAGAAGTSTALVVAGVAGAGAAAAGVAASTGGGGTPTTGTTQTTQTQPQAPPTPTPPPPTPPPPSQSTNRPPVPIIVVNPDPPSGLAPLRVRFDACATKDPDGDPLTFRFDFGDGARDSGGCQSTHTYTNVSFGARAAGSFEARVSVSDNVNPTVTRGYAVDVRCPSPRVKLTFPADKSNVTRCPFIVSADASDSVGIAKVDFFAEAGRSAFSFGSDTDAPYGANFDKISFGTVKFSAVATNSCGNQGDDSAVANLSCYGAGRTGLGASSRLSWTSDLSVAGARGQVVLNGSDATFPGYGRSMELALGRQGLNRVEAQLVEAAGVSGTWRFDFGGNAEFETGSLNVLAGDAVDVTATGITFRLSGRAGERIAFTFASKPQQ